MKSIKLIFALLLLSFSAVAQQNISTDYANQINAAFAGINLNQVPHGLLKDYAMEFAELNDYDSNLTKENIHQCFGRIRPSSFRVGMGTTHN